MYVMADFEMFIKYVLTKKFELKPKYNQNKISHQIQIGSDVYSLI